MSRFRRVPKVELHVHLEGAIPLDRLWELMGKYGGDPTVPDRAALTERFRYRSFPHFIEVWGWKNTFLREPADFTLIAEGVARSLLDQNVRYAEITHSPTDFTGAGLEPQELIRAIRRGLDRVPEVRTALVIDLVRDHGPRQGERTLSQVAEVREQGVAGITIGGSEQLFPPEPFAGVFHRARKLGFRTSAHAGEAAGPESIWGAIRSLQVDRIGHGARAVEDPALVEHLVEKQIPLELCPVSNLRTGVVALPEEHPIRELHHRGALVTVSTDDPAMFGTDLAGEYELLQQELGFTPDEIREIAGNGARSAWLPPEERESLVAWILEDPSWRLDA